MKELATIKQQLAKEREEQEAKNQQWQEKLNQQELTRWKDMTAGHQSGMESIRTLYSQQRPPPAPQQQNPYQQHNPDHQQSQLYNGFNYPETRYNTMRMPEYNDYGRDHSKREDNKPLKIDPNTPVFGKTKIDIEYWIFTFENVCIVGNVPYDKYIRLAINYTHGLSLTMVRSAIINELIWTQLKNALLKSHTPPEKKRNLNIKLLNLRQDGSFQKFAEEFRLLAARLNTDEEDMLDLFSSAVNKKTRDFFAVSRPQTFDEAFELAARINGEELTTHSVNTVQKQKNVQCHHCKKTGHIEKDCWKKKVSGNSFIGKDKEKVKPSFKKIDFKINKKPTNPNYKDQKIKDSKCHRCGKKG